MSLDATLRALRDAGSFLEVGRALTELRRSTEMVGVGVDLWSRSGVPVAIVDDITAAYLPDEARLFYLTHAYATDPLRLAMLAEHRQVGPEIYTPSLAAISRAAGWRGAVLDALYTPLVDDAGVIGSLRLTYAGSVTASTRRDVERLATHVSVKLAKLGVDAPEPDRSVLAMTARQRSVADLVALDLTNGEIGDALGISVNAVKKHLKRTFSGLGVRTRGDLVQRLRRSVAPVDVPPGVTHRGDVHATRLDLHERR